MSLYQQLTESLKGYMGTASEEAISRIVAERIGNTEVGFDQLPEEVKQLIIAVRNSRDPKKNNMPSIPKLNTSENQSVPPSKDTQAILSDILVGNNVYLYGVAGSGKTFLAKQIAKLLGRGFELINCSQWTSPINIVGGQTIRGYQEGALVRAWREGKVLILDELPKLDPNTAGLLNEALAETGNMVQLDHDGKPIYWPSIMDGQNQPVLRGGGDLEKAKGFAVIATGNTDMKTTPANYSGNNRQDYSLVDRFSGCYYRVDFPYDQAYALIHPCVYRVAEEIRRYLIQNRDRMESISLRTMLNFSRNYEFYMLKKINSKYFDDTVFAPKTLDEAIDSFIKTLDDRDQMEIAKTSYSQLLTEGCGNIENFIAFVIARDGTNPRTGTKATSNEIDKAKSVVARLVNESKTMYPEI